MSPTSADYLALCTELLHTLKQYQDRVEDSYHPDHPESVQLDTSAQLISRAEAFLAQPPPEPEVSDRISRALIAISGGLCYFTAEAKHAQLLAAQNILTGGLQSPPEPVPVEAIAEQAYVAFVQICKGNSDDAGTYNADEELVRRALKKLSDLERVSKSSPGAEVNHG